MRAKYIGGLLALALLVAIAAVAGPAVATPNTTGSSADPPYWTPIGNTVNSSFTATSMRFDFSALSGDGVTTFGVTCQTRLTAYVPQTHTRALVTELLPQPCSSPTFPGAQVFVGTNASSVTPFGLHLRNRVAANSWGGTFAIPNGGNITIWVVDGAMTLCRVQIGAQSFRFVDTDVTTSIVINDSTAIFSNTVANDISCPDPAGTGTLAGAFTFRSQTATDNLRSTAASEG
jgi:hypothetical protein